ncbi:MAG: hypothetical protein COT55_03150 [Candidatus Diapherotrites archaeon CG09_land_8_20_14_0_10_32_12]|nr:MAG: hypothetical protein COT55_03150 [Candidatus Diapherotrites archaeon CG09_land_8_20_14_0_10_32_12]
MNITINVGNHINNILESLIKKGVVKTKSEALRLGILTLADKYALDSNNEKEAYKLLAQRSLEKVWKDEPEGLWESYLND